MTTREFKVTFGRMKICRMAIYNNDIIQNDFQQNSIQSNDINQNYYWKNDKLNEAECNSQSDIYKMTNSRILFKQKNTIQNYFDQNQTLGELPWQNHDITC